MLASVRVYVVRHAEAEPGEPDDLRSLTREGLAAARALGESLVAEGARPDAVLTSPLLRARETAELIAGREPEPDDRLAPGATEADVRAAVAGRAPETDDRLAPGADVDDVRAAVAGRGDTVLLVGHQPDCSRIAAALGGGPEPRFPPAGAVAVDV